jgi:ribosomal protein S18 acetylase RimI-like enzyme
LRPPSRRSAVVRTPEKSGVTRGMVAAVHVRPGRLPEDLEAILRVDLETSPSIVDQTRRGMWYAYRRFPPGLFVAEHQGTVVGFLQLGFLRPISLTYFLGKMPWTLPTAFYMGVVRMGLLKEFEVANIVVSPEFRARGVAYRLMDVAEREAVRTYGQPTIGLLVREENDRALRFYERLGYERIKTIPVRVGEKLLMRKTLVDRNDPPGRRINPTS